MLLQKKKESALVEGATALKRACTYGLMKISLRALSNGEEPFATIGKSRTLVSPSRMPSAFELPSCHYVRCLMRSDRRENVNAKLDVERHTRDTLPTSESETSMQK